MGKDVQRSWCMTYQWFLSSNRLKEPLYNSARSAFCSEKPQIVCGGPSDSSLSYGLGVPCASCGFSGETLSGRTPDQVWGRLFTEFPSLPGALIWPTNLTAAKPQLPESGLNVSLSISRTPIRGHRRARAELYRGSLHKPAWLTGLPLAWQNVAFAQSCGHLNTDENDYQVYLKKASSPVSGEEI